MSKVLDLDSRAALVALLRQPVPAKPFTLRLTLPDLATETREETEARLASRLSACGCTEGAVGLMLGLIPALVVADSQPDATTLTRWGLGLAVVVAAMLAGKLVGHLRAKAGLRAEIEAILQASTPSHPA